MRKSTASYPGPFLIKKILSLNPVLYIQISIEEASASDNIFFINKKAPGYEGLREHDNGQTKYSVNSLCV